MNSLDCLFRLLSLWQCISDPSKLSWPFPLAFCNSTWLSVASESMSDAVMYLLCWLENQCFIQGKNWWQMCSLCFSLSQWIEQIHMLSISSFELSFFRITVNFCCNSQKPCNKKLGAITFSSKVANSKLFSSCICRLCEPNAITTQSQVWKNKHGR